MMTLMRQQLAYGAAKDSNSSEQFPLDCLLQPGREAKENNLYFLCAPEPNFVALWCGRRPRRGLRRLAARAELINQIKSSSKARHSPFTKKGLTS